jgi:preprotein translocase subunit SecG
MQATLEIISVISAILLTLFVLVQTRGASLGAGFGGSGEIHTARRGVDKTIHQITVFLAVIFATSLLLILFIK